MVADRPPLGFTPPQMPTTTTENFPTAYVRITSTTPNGTTTAPTTPQPTSLTPILHSKLDRLSSLGSSNGHGSSGLVSTATGDIAKDVEGSNGSGSGGSFFSWGTNNKGSSRTIRITLLIASVVALLLFVFCDDPRSRFGFQTAPPPPPPPQPQSVRVMRRVKRTIKRKGSSNNRKEVALRFDVNKLQQMIAAHETALAAEELKEASVPHCPRSLSVGSFPLSPSSPLDVFSAVAAARNEEAEEVEADEAYSNSGGNVPTDKPAVNKRHRRGRNGGRKSPPIVTDGESSTAITVNNTNATTEVDDELGTFESLWNNTEMVYEGVGRPSEAVGDGRGKGRCLVIISLHSCGLDIRLPEWTNLPHFLHHGYIPANTSTAMFSSVEYVFVTNDGSETADDDSPTEPTFHDIAGVPNVRIAITPPATSDLHMVQLLFPYITAKDITRYITLNTGSRGPLMPSNKDGWWGGSGGSAAAERNPYYYWVDVVGGHALLDHMTRLKAKPSVIGGARASLCADTGALVVGSSYSRQIRPHMQSYFLSLPPIAAHQYYGKVRFQHNKNHAILGIETAVPLQLHQMGFTQYAMGQGLRFAKGTKFVGHNDNPIHTATCPLCYMFPKYGGDAWRTQSFPPKRFNEETENITRTMRSELLSAQQHAAGMGASGLGGFRNTAGVDGISANNVEKGPRTADNSDVTQTPATILARMHSVPLIASALRAHWCSDFDVNYLGELYYPTPQPTTTVATTPPPDADSSSLLLRTTTTRRPA